MRIVRALADRGHRITFYEPDAFQSHRDIAMSVLYHLRHPLLALDRIHDREGDRCRRLPERSVESGARGAP